MKPLPPNPRYERKLLPGGLRLDDILAIIHRHPAAFRQSFPPRAINNIYLDSPEWRDYHDHVSGVAHRTKTRVRWYGPWSGHIQSPTLERKLKHGLVSGKASHRLPALTMNGSLSRSELTAAIETAEMPALTRSTVQQLQPSLLNRYERRYYRSADDRFCLTIDTNLQFAPARQAPGTHALFTPPLTQVVVELKFGLAAAEEAERVTNLLPFRLARCSKYILGLNSIRAV
jgi:hypothetical protein